MCIRYSVGIVANESDRLDNVRAATPGVYVTYAQSPVDGVFLAVKGADDAAALVKPVQRAVWQVDKGQTFDDVRLLADIRASAFAADRLRAGLLGAFAALALILASTGIYGVLSYLGAQRRPELAVRAALGASSRELAALVLRSAARPIGIGVAAGAVGALGAGLGLRTLLFETSPADPATALAVGLLLAGVAFAACYLPAHRASRTDPMTALRHE